MGADGRARYLQAWWGRRRRETEVEFAMEMGVCGRVKGIALYLEEQIGCCFFVVLR
jgi:hypothetical protein